MSYDLAGLGEPHIKLAGLKLWIHGYQYRDCTNDWDANWLNATAICSEGGATVLVRGSFIRTNELSDWQRAVDKLNADLAGEANLVCMESDLAVTLAAKSLGAMVMQVDITPCRLTQQHSFEFSIDQSYLSLLSTQCSRILDAFPIRGA